ncbi:uncharacterized protein MYCFIDRAFT_175084 [Pseudocercospora fijiensis CIRAD86]|uniref:Uncharacterized protein n=1 Tax=Pseudocercospora fijiensis (strain CIRAD86) TaxID=383855 RepID=M3B2N7_PSEFD|nr:uncharacterized protein MYCFIDRAFT_175084 [Pseudocercospora fijiensis CIRAD86]EME83657.1 hypothetical protein MYCFIDRAFT_175084 [Pseudocercospora fijiensis CIRAD86]
MKHRSTRIFDSVDHIRRMSYIYLRKVALLYRIANADLQSIVLKHYISASSFSSRRIDQDESPRAVARSSEAEQASAAKPLSDVEGRFCPRVCRERTPSHTTDIHAYHQHNHHSLHHTLTSNTMAPPSPSNSTINAEPRNRIINRDFQEQQQPSSCSEPVEKKGEPVMASTGYHCVMYWENGCPSIVAWYENLPSAKSSHNLAYATWGLESRGDDGELFYISKATVVVDSLLGVLKRFRGRRRRTLSHITANGSSVETAIKKTPAFSTRFTTVVRSMRPLSIHPSESTTRFRNPRSSRKSSRGLKNQVEVLASKEGNGKPEADMEDASGEDQKQKDFVIDGRWIMATRMGLQGDLMRSGSGDYHRPYHAQPLFSPSTQDASCWTRFQRQTMRPRSGVQSTQATAMMPRTRFQSSRQSQTKMSRIAVKRERESAIVALLPTTTVSTSAANIIEEPYHLWDGADHKVFQVRRMRESWVKSNDMEFFARHFSHEQ